MSIPKVHMLSRLIESGVIAVIRRIPTEQINQVVTNLVEGGVTALEVTVDSTEGYASIEKIKTKYGKVATIGAGTVLDEESAKKAIESGADFIFSPSLHKDVIRTSLRYGKIAIPGVMTPTEMLQAMEWGADVVKLFPASVLGANFIKDVSAPFPQVPIIPTGGIDLSNIADFIHAGAIAVGLGSTLIKKDEMQMGNYSGIQVRAKQFIQAVQKARGDLN